MIAVVTAFGSGIAYGLGQGVGLALVGLLGWRGYRWFAGRVTPG